MPYPEAMVSPMRAELVDMGVRELRTEEEVDTFFKSHPGTAVVLVNSVCGCAAGSARPALKLALQHDQRPEHAVTVFAGQDLEATERARTLFGQVPPSSPCFALLKDGELLHFLPRHLIEGQSAQGVAQELMAGFDEHCN